MWSGDTSTTAGAGGFYETTNKFDSPGAGTGKKEGSRKIQSVTPMVISMLQENDSDELTIWGHQVTMIKLVGIVRKFEVTSTTVVYEIEDHTGSMKAMYWLEQGNNSDIPVDKENIYVRLYANLRTKGDEKVLMILKIAPIDNINEITTHLLETIHVRIQQEKKSKGEQVSIRANNPGAGLSNSMQTYEGTVGEMEEEGMTPMQKNVFKFMKTVRADPSLGITRECIHEHFPPNQKRDVDAALGFLVSEGHIFSTIDTDHFQLTNSF